MYAEVQDEMIAARRQFLAVRDQMSIDLSIPFVAVPNALSAVRERLGNIPGLTISMVQLTSVHQRTSRNDPNDGKTI